MSMVKGVVIATLASAVFIGGISCVNAQGADSNSNPQSSMARQEGGHQSVGHMTSNPSSMMAARIKPMNKNFTITYLQLTSADPKVVSNAECLAFSGQTAIIDKMPNGTGDIDHNIVLKNYKAGRSYIGHNFSRNMWSADFTYTAKDGKVYHSRAYGEELLVKGMNVAYGSFVNGYCEGYYKKTF